MLLYHIVLYISVVELTNVKAFYFRIFCTREMLNKLDSIYSQRPLNMKAIFVSEMPMPSHIIDDAYMQCVDLASNSYCINCRNISIST